MEQSKKTKLSRFIKAVIVTLCGIIGFFGIVLAIIYILLTPERLTPIVNKYANEYLDATVRFDTVKLSLFEELPYVSLKVCGGEVISRAYEGEPDSVKQFIPQRADTLLRFDEFLISLDLPKLLTSRISVRRIKLTNPDIYAYVSASGRANWEIYSSGDTTTNSSTSIPVFDINRFIIKNHGHLVYNSVPDSLLLKLDVDRFRIKGNKEHEYDVNVVAALSVNVDSLPYCTSLPLAIHGGFAFDTLRQGGIHFDQMQIKVAEMPFLFDGNVLLANDHIFSEMDCRIDSLPLSGLLSLVPEQMLPALKGINTDISVNVNTTVRGNYVYEKNQLPAFTVDFSVDKGYLYYNGTKLKIENFLVDASLRYSPVTPDSTAVILRKLDVKGTGINLSGEGVFSNLLIDPTVNASFKGEINLDTLSAVFPSKKGNIVKGKLGLDTKAQFKKSQLSYTKIGNTRVKGKITMDDLLIELPADTLRIYINGGAIGFGASENKRDTTMSMGLELLRISIKADTANIRYKNELTLKASGARAGVRSAASSLIKDTTCVHPLAGSLRARYFEVEGIDSARTVALGAMCRFSVLPSKNQKSVPMLKMSIGTDRLFMRSELNRYALRNSQIEVEATLSTQTKDRESRRKYRLDSLQRVYPSVPRDSIYIFMQSKNKGNRVVDDLTDGDLDLKVDSGLAALLRRWKVNGTIKAGSGRIITPYFPLRNQLHNVDVRFDTDRLDLLNTTIRSGKSDVRLTGSISNIRRSLLGSGRLKVDLSLVSDTLDINELIRAANAGTAYNGATMEQLQQLKEAKSDDHLQQLINQQGIRVEDQSSLLIIPKNIEVNVGFEVRYGLYARMQLLELSGGLIAKDRCLQLRNLKAVTDAGEMQLTALYATRSRKDITTGFDLEMRKIHVDKLISLVPSVDSLLPMLRSLQGVVDCQMAATAAIDTSMNILLPSLNAACRLNGENMVLLDGETFTEISKMLRFKNKERNMLDKISVEMIVKDNALEMFPFVLEMDRYKAAVSGVHKLDMSFKYHISVLRSPLPFKLGVDIWGTLDKYKFRLGKARYRENTIPSYVALIDTTRINLRENIINIFKRGVEAATLSPLTLNTGSVPASIDDLPQVESFTASDSLLLMKEGLIDSTQIKKPQIVAPVSYEKVKKTEKIRNGRKKNAGIPSSKSEAIRRPDE